MKFYGKNLIAFISIIVFLLCSFVLFRWQIHKPAFYLFNVRFGRMNPIVALSFLFVSYSNISLVFNFRYTKEVTKIIGLFILLVAFSKLFSLIFNIDLFIDKSLYGSQFNVVTFRNPRQGMSSYALINLFIFGLHYLMFFSTNRKQKSTIVFLLVIAFFISLLNLLYHVFNATELTKVFGFYPMVGHAALCSTLLSALALLQNYPYGVMQDFSSPYLGGRFSRILSPIILIVPITFGFIKYYLTKEYNLSDEFGLVILIVILIILLYIVTNYLSSKLNQIHQSQTEFEQNYSHKLEKEIYQRTEELRINERKFQALIENSTDITILLNKDADLIYISPSFERMLGYTLEEIKSINTFELLHPDTMKETREEFNLMLQNLGVIYPSTQRILCKDGKYIWGQGSVINLLNDPNVNAIVANYRDITGNKELEDEIIKLNKYLEVKIRIRTKELEKANNELKMFTYSVSHDLRTPLAAIDGFATFIDEFHKNDLNEEVKESIVHIKNSAKRMNSLINDLLNLSKVGKIELLKKENNIQSLIMKVIDDYKITNINAPSIIVNPIDIKCKIDESLMQQVWMNLISNAVKYSAKKQEPKIEIGYDEFENEYEFYIKDNGVGFDMGKADKLFGVFQRMHNNTEFEGTGIGLALVKLIIEKHGGTIWANSVINEGTTFYFTLPKK